MDCIIRTCHVNDVPFLVDLALEVHNLHVDNRPGEFRRIERSDLERFYLDMISAEDQIFLVAELAELTVGYILIRIVSRDKNPFQKQLRFAYLDQISVGMEYRGHGIGKKLIESVITILKKKKVRKLKLDVWEFNRQARDFFLSRGFKPQLHRMEMSLK